MVSFRSPLFGLLIVQPVPGLTLVSTHPSRLFGVLTVSAHKTVVVLTDSFLALVFSLHYVHNA